MAQWEHRRCGTVYDSGQNPPEGCEFCAALLIRVTKFSEAGWRRVGSAQKNLLPARVRGWECQSCQTIWKQKRCPVYCETCRRRRGYIPRWREIRVHKDPRRNRSGVQTPSRRELVMARDKYTCQQCGETKRNLLTLDHIIPKSKGGTNEVDNLQVLCRPCNNKKGDSLP